MSDGQTHWDILFLSGPAVEKQFCAPLLQGFTAAKDAPGSASAATAAVDDKSARLVDGGWLAVGSCKPVDATARPSIGAFGEPGARSFAQLELAEGEI